MGAEAHDSDACHSGSANALEEPSLPGHRLVGLVVELLAGDQDHQIRILREDVGRVVVALDADQRVVQTEAVDDAPARKVGDGASVPECEHGPAVPRAGEARQELSQADVGVLEGQAVGAAVECDGGVALAEPEPARDGDHQYHAGQAHARLQRAPPGHPCREP